MVDLSHLIDSKISVFPDTIMPVSEQLASVIVDGYTDRLLKMSSHTGTHVDAPAHILANGLTLDQFPLNAFTGSGVVMDCRGVNEITIAFLMASAAELREIDYLLLFTGWSKYWGTATYLENFPTLTVESASWLAKLNLKGIGVDTISIDKIADTQYPVHKQLLETNKIIIENLNNLDKLINKRFIFTCLPLKLFNADASPVRAAAMLTNGKPA